MCAKLARASQRKPGRLPRPSVYPRNTCLVSVVVDNVAAGVARKEILRSYPALTDPDVDAALAYAAELTREGTVDLPLEIKT
jgi:hypothetical protein